MIPNVHFFTFISFILSRVFECLVHVHLGQFMKWRGVRPTTRFAYKKGLGTCDTLRCVAHPLQSALEAGEAKIVQIVFSAVLTGQIQFKFNSSIHSKQLN